MKLEVYAVLCELNRGFEQAIRSLEKLRAMELAAHDLAEIRKAALEQLRAEICHTAILGLAEQEREDATSFERQRISRERQLTDKA